MKHAYEARLKDFVLGRLGARKCKVVLFGSRARGSPAHPGADFDVGVLPYDQDLSGDLAALAEELEESTFPFEVDLVDLRLTSDEFRDKVLRDGVVWKES